MTNQFKIGEKVRVLYIGSDNFNSVLFVEGIIKDYYNFKSATIIHTKDSKSSNGCNILVTKEFLRFNYNIAKVGDEQDFLYEWLEFAKDKEKLKKLKIHFPKLKNESPFVFR
jgi:hypothetical protein